MRKFYLFGFLALLAFDTLAQISFKYAANLALPLQLEINWFLRVFSIPWIYGALLGYLGTFVIWMTLLKHAPVGPSVAASHMELVTVSLLSVWLFNEPYTLHKAVGACLIILGVLCLAKDAEE